MTIFTPSIPRAALSASALAFTFFPSAPLSAQTAQTDDYHAPKDQIVVTANGIKSLDVLAGAAVVSGDVLQRNQEGQLGEVLAKLPGVSASGFAPGASRPILRGMQGERVRILIDGLGASDLSNTSADHATAADPLTAESIEVLRGPAVLLYGSQAIGGAVNVIDKRIPLRRMSEGYHLDAITGFDSAYNLRKGGVSLDMRLGEDSVAHVDGTRRLTSDLTIPGFVASPRFRHELLAEDKSEAANLRGKLPGSFTNSWALNGGLSVFKGGSSFGASLGVLDTSYGVPTKPGDGESGVSIGLHQTRADAKSVLDLGDGFFGKLNSRIGYSNYTHTEFEGEEIGTVFKAQSVEMRHVLEQNMAGAWRGSVGVQYAYRDFDAIGAEAYIPKNQSHQLAAFALQEVDLGAFELELSGRIENSKTTSSALGFTRQFTSLSGAAGLSYENANGLKYGVNFSRVARAPSAEELLSDGAHIATQSYEIGNFNLVKESALGLENYLRGAIGGTSVTISAYYNWFDNYIYQQPTGQDIEGLPVYAYAQSGVRHYGFEGQLSAPLYTDGIFALSGELSADYVRASLVGGTPLPRTPPLSVKGALNASFGRIEARGEIEYYDAQTRTAPLETATPSYTFVNANLTWHPLSENKNLTVIIMANNIFDAEGRRHTSFTKDYVPLSGRNFKISLRISV